MNGRDLTLGALAGLAVAGLLTQRRGSRDEALAFLTRGVLRLPGQGPIKIKKLGAGAFATAYVTTEATPPVVYVFTPDDVYDKELLAMARDAEPQNPHLPQVEKVGETRDQFIYAMPLYRAPFRKVDSASGWKDYMILKKCRSTAWDTIKNKGVTYSEVYAHPIPGLYKGGMRRVPVYPQMNHRGYEVNEETVACAERAGVSPSTLEALRILVDTAANYSDDYVFEFSPRNLATDDAGNFVLLDPLFDREKLQAKHQRERRKAEQAFRGRGW
jgi:hypothetical protein